MFNQNSKVVSTLPKTERSLPDYRPIALSLGVVEARPRNQSGERMSRLTLIFLANLVLSFGIQAEEQTKPDQEWQGIRYYSDQADRAVKHVDGTEGFTDTKSISDEEWKGKNSAEKYWKLSTKLGAKDVRIGVIAKKYTGFPVIGFGTPDGLQGTKYETDKGFSALKFKNVNEFFALEKSGTDVDVIGAIDEKVTVSSQSEDEVVLSGKFEKLRKGYGFHFINKVPDTSAIIRRDYFISGDINLDAAESLLKQLRLAFE